MSLDAGRRVWWCGMPEPVRALACGSPRGVVFRFVAVCPDGGLVHRRNGRGAVGRDRWSGRLCGVVLPCCDDRPVGGGGGCRACARGPAVGVIAAGFARGGVAGCLLVRVPALLAAVPGGSGTGRDRLVTG